VRTLAGGSKLRDNNLVDERNVRLNVEQVGRKLNRSGLDALDVENVE
jgi:hypothetical protein